MTTLKQINKRIQREMPTVELVKGEGYFYLVCDDVANNVYETQSIMTPFLKDQTAQRWIDDARAFFAKLGF